MSQYETIIILLDGDVSPTSWLLALAKNAHVIAADGGIRHAETLGAHPALWIGDFDSTAIEYSKKYAEVERSEHPSEKNTSDGELALELALKSNPKRIVICGAMGGARNDHVMFNMLGALRLAQQNPDIEFIMTGQDQIAFPILPGQTLEIQQKFGSVLSIIPISALRKLSVSGVKWPLAEIDIEMGSSHTLSNILTAPATIHLNDGHAIAIVHDKN